jgi:hypothetical protein
VPTRDKDSGFCPFTDCDGSCIDTLSSTSSCGTCGHDCEGNLCASGLCLATGVAIGTTPVSLVVDSTNVYFTDAVGTVVQAPSGGGTAVTLASGVPGPFGIAVDPAFVYFTNQGAISGSGKDGSVLKVPIAQGSPGDGGADSGPGDAGAPTAIATGRKRPQAIAVTATDVYWVESSSTSNGEILTCPTAGCPKNEPTVVASALASPSGLAVDADGDVYVTTSAGGTVNRYTKSGSTWAVQVLADSLNEPTGIALVGGTVYWATTGTGAIESIPATGGSPSILAATMGAPSAIAADAVNVYWSDSAPIMPFGPLNSCVVTGCPPTGPVLLVGISQTATDIAIDSLFVYWIATGGQILRVAK